MPIGVAEIGLGYEYLRCAWVAKDDHFNIRKRKLAAAMQGEIVADGLRWNSRKERGHAVPTVVETCRPDSDSGDSVWSWLESVCLAIIREGREGDRREGEGPNRSKRGDSVPCGVHQRRSENQARLAADG